MAEYQATIEGTVIAVDQHTSHTVSVNNDNFGELHLEIANLQKELLQEKQKKESLKRKLRRITMGAPQALEFAKPTPKTPASSSRQESRIQVTTLSSPFVPPAAASTTFVPSTPSSPLSENTSSASSASTSYLGSPVITPQKTPIGSPLVNTSPTNSLGSSSTDDTIGNGASQSTGKKRKTIIIEGSEISPVSMRNKRPRTEPSSPAARSSST